MRQAFNEEGLSSLKHFILVKHTPIEDGSFYHFKHYGRYYAPKLLSHELEKIKAQRTGGAPKSY